MNDAPVTSIDDRALEGRLMGVLRDVRRPLMRPEEEDYLSAVDAVYERALDPATPNPTTADVALGCPGLKTRLQTHRRRAARLKSEIERTRACQAILQEALHRIDFAIFVVGDDRRIVFANAAAKADATLSITDGALMAGRCTDPALQAAITCGLSGCEPDDVLIASSGRAPLTATVLPATRPQQPQGAVATALVLLSDPESQIAAGVDVVARTFRLTAGETRLLSAIAAGEGLRPAAARLNIGAATARTHLQRVFAKTQTERQSELMRLVATLAPPARRRMKA